MYLLAAVQVDIFAIIILAILYFKNISRTDNISGKLFNSILFSTIIILLLDVGMFLFDGRSVVVMTILSLLYYIFTPIIGYLAMIYLLFLIYRSVKKIYKITLRFIPFFLVYIFSCFASIKTGWLFKISKDAVYIRGDYFWLSVLICLLFLIVPLFFSAKLYFITTDKLSRKFYLSITFLIFPPALGALIQYLFYGVSTNWIGTTISIFIMFINLQNNEISTDPLTGINNRRVMYRYLENKIASYSANQRLFVYIIDVDVFKTINDEFGHTEGDNALIYISEILRSLCTQNGDFLARMGGDEFCIVCQRKVDENTDELIEQLNSKIQRFNDLGCASYNLSLSIGLAEFGVDDVNTVDDVIRKADKMMYEQKKLKRSGVNI